MVDETLFYLSLVSNAAGHSAHLFRISSEDKSANSNIPIFKSEKMILIYLTSERTKITQFNFYKCQNLTFVYYIF